MSCGVSYQFSIVNLPHTAEVIAEAIEPTGTPQDAREAGPADPRASGTPDVIEPIPARGRQQRSQR